MSCCCPHSKSGGRIFSFFARSYRRRFSKHGFEPSQQQLMHGIENAGYKNNTLLEVGSGVGYFHQVLLEQGAKSAVGIDFSPDITILDKVVCCYPHAELLINHSVNKTKHVYALTYPRSRWFIKVAIGIMAFFLKLSGSDFRAFVHNPDDIECWITEAGFKKTYQEQTFIWLSQTYQK